MTRRYLTCAETAKLIRKALKKSFPGQKFSVRSSTYAGGASIRVTWMDGPTQAQVTAVADAYSGSGFDGMTDYKYSVDRWLMPDGSVSVARVESHYGHEGTKTEQPHPSAELVAPGADFVFCDRDISEQFEAKCESAWQHLTPQERCDLENHHMPRWQLSSIGRRLASITPA